LVTLIWPESYTCVLLLRCGSAALAIFSQSTFVAN